MTFWIAAGVFFLDRFTKTAVINSIFLGTSVKIIPNIFHLTLVLNRGTAFGLFKGQRIFFISLSVAAIAAIVIYLLRHRDMNRARSLALGLVLGGAAGNLLDRVWFGPVIDFLDFRIWPVFNVADSSITIGATMLALKVLSASAFNKK